MSTPSLHRPSNVDDAAQLEADLWGGHAAERIVAVIAEWAASRLPTDDR